jgi:dTDP-4-dehydrorhamnose reductase
MKVIIVGAYGYIGKELYSEGARLFDVYGTTSNALKATEKILFLQLDEPESFDFEIISNSDTVLLTAAISAPDVCAQERERAWATNVAGTTAFISRVISRGGRVIFFSSDTVYGERKNHFDELAICNPAGEYAAMKYDVEGRFMGNPLFKAIRLSYVFSFEDKFTKYLFGCADRDEEAEVFHPFYRAVIHRDDVVEGALALALRWEEFPQQVINFGGPEILARTGFAETMQQTVLPLLRFRVTEPSSEFFENRPRYIAMLSPTLPKLLGRPSHTLLEAASIESAAS